MGMYLVDQDSFMGSMRTHLRFICKPVNKINDIDKQNCPDTLKKIETHWNGFLELYSIQFLNANLSSASLPCNLTLQYLN